MDAYTTRTEPIKSKPPFWDQLKVEILRSSDGAVLGSYVRTYPTFFKTFHPFDLGGKSLALYSPQHTATRLMELPSCQDIGGETPHPNGFCPVEFYVPPGKNFGFVAGCVWGDDSSWKIQFLDLSRATEGIVIRDDRFGYLELPDNVPLADAIRLIENPGFEPSVDITNAVEFELRTGSRIDPYK